MTNNSHIIKQDNLNDNKYLRDNENNQIDDKRINRRKKKDNDGRTYICKNCDKAYLSYPALYTHIKIKHKTNGVISERGRGRPKNNLIDNNTFQANYNPCDLDYFKHQDKTGETKDMGKCIEIVFNDLYIDKYNSKLKSYKIVSDHPLLNKLLNNENKRQLNPEDSTCDEVFLEYLQKVSKLCRDDYFIRILKFILLFRECLNKMNKIQASLYEFCDFSNSEDAPEISNEFVTEFMDDENEFNYTKEEVIDLTQNLCQYMYDNSFTCSKLSLIRI